MRREIQKILDARRKQNIACCRVCDTCIRSGDNLHRQGGVLTPTGSNQNVLAYRKIMLLVCINWVRLSESRVA